MSEWAQRVDSSKAFVLLTALDNLGMCDDGGEFC